MKQLLIGLLLICVAGCATAPLPVPTAVQPARVFLPVARYDSMTVIYNCEGIVTDRDWLEERFGDVEWTAGVTSTLSAIWSRCGDQPASVTVYVEHDRAPSAMVPVKFSWPDGFTIGKTNACGEVGFAYGEGAWYEPPEGGPHSITVGAVVVSGLGMIALTNHEHLDLEVSVP